MIRPVRPWPYRFLRATKWRRLDSNLRAYSPRASVCRSSGRQSMTKLSRDICEVSSVQSCDERTGAFSHHLDARPVREMWAGLTCAKFSVACLRMMATFNKETRSSLLANPHHISASIVWKNYSCEIFSGSLVSIASLAAVTTARTGVKILVSFWPEHSLRSDLRALNFISMLLAILASSGGCPLALVHSTLLPLGKSLKNAVIATSLAEDLLVASYFLL